MFSLQTKAILVGVALVILAGVYWRESVRWYNKGWSAALQQVEKQNKAANTEISDATRKVLDCDKRGGTWDVSVGVCN